MMTKDSKKRIRNSTADFLVFTKDTHADGIEVRVQGGDVWLTQKVIGQLFEVDRSVVTKHLKAIYASGELAEEATCANFAQIADNGKTYRYKFYSLAAIIAVRRWKEIHEVRDMFYETADLKSKEIFLRLEKTCDAQPEKQWLPAYYFDICLLNGSKIGCCDLRIGHNDKTYVGGNIGYSIEKAYRGHHFAAKACELLFLQAKKHGMDHVIITCDPANPASARTCELAGGMYMETVDIPEDNEMYSEGKRQVMVYRFNL